MTGVPNDMFPASHADVPGDSGIAAESLGSSGFGTASIRSTWSIPSDPSESTMSAPAPPPLVGALEPLPVAGHPDAWLSLPTGATSRRPVVVAIHGARDRADRQCRDWRHATSEYPFILCPKRWFDAETNRSDPRYADNGEGRLLAYIDDALEALAARYPHYADTTNPLLAGFSLGAAQVTALAVQFPSRFPRVALVEGATRAWSQARVSAFLQGGGQRVLFGCGQEGVKKTAERVAKRLADVGLAAHVVFVNVGHRFAPRLEDAVRDELPWLLEGDDRWPAPGE
jgi:pimeloyl-ACP methyl ester carboxylesterase